MCEINPAIEVSRIVSCDWVEKWKVGVKGEDRRDKTNEEKKNCQKTRVDKSSQRTEKQCWKVKIYKQKRLKLHE